MEKEENETVKRRCVSSNLAEALHIFSQGEDSESCGGFSWCDLLDNFDDLSGCESESRAAVSVVLAVPDVPVHPSSVVTELCDVSSCCPGWEFVEPQSFPFSEKRPFTGDSFSGNHDI